MGRFNHLLIAASYAWIDRGLDPNGALPMFDERIVWADLAVEHHGMVMRQDKIGELADFLNQGDLSLRVCLRSSLTDGYLNDGVCEKCFRTIACMIVHGIDPNICGFNVGEATWEKMREMILRYSSKRLAVSWEKIHEISREGVEYEFHGSNAFFDWFRDFDYESRERKWFWTDVYTALPYAPATVLERVLNRLDITINKDAYIRE